MEINRCSKANGMRSRIANLAVFNANNGTLPMQFHGEGVNTTARNENRHLDAHSNGRTSSGQDHETIATDVPSRAFARLDRLVSVWPPKADRSSDSISIRSKKFKVMHDKSLGLLYEFRRF